MTRRMLSVMCLALAGIAGYSTSAQQQLPMPDGAAAPAAGEKPGAAPAVFVEAQADFGVALPGVNKLVNLTLRNTGNEQLKVRAAVSNCACTAASVPMKTIEPGGTTRVIVSLDFPKSLGKLRRELRVFFEGYQAPTIIAVVGEASYPIRVNKDDFPEVLTMKGVVRLDALDGKPFRVLGMNGQPARMTGFDPLRDEPRAGYAIEFDFLGLAEAQLPRYVVIQTDRPDAEMIDVKVNSPRVWGPWRPAGQWRVNDDRVILGTLSAGASAEFVATLTLPPDPKLQPTVACSDAAYKLEVVSAKVGTLGASTTDVTLRLTPPPGVSGFVHVVLTFNAGGGSSSVDVFGAVRK